MEALNDAINARKKVSFQYFTYNVRKEQKLKYDGYTYVFSPYKLIWNGDYYYVVGFSEKHKGIGSFRVDRIAKCPIILDDDAVYPPKNFDLNVYLNSMFRMYNGQRKQIELVCSNDVMDAIIDKFGKDVHVLANDMKSFRAIIETSVGSVFYSWIFGFGGRVVIKSPEDVKDEYSGMVLNAAKSLRLFECGESENQKCAKEGLTMPKIIRNAIRCKKCGDVIESKTVHDFKFCSCGSCAVDGGHDYLRRCGNREDWEELPEAEKVENSGALT